MKSSHFFIQRVLSVLWWMLLILQLWWILIIVGALGIRFIPDTPVTIIVIDVAHILSWGLAMVLLYGDSNQLKTGTVLSIFLSVVGGLIWLRYFTEVSVLYSLSMLFSPIVFIVILFKTRE